MILVKHFVQGFTSCTHHIRPGIHGFDHVTHTVTDLCHASNTDLVEYILLLKLFFFFFLGGGGDCSNLPCTLQFLILMTFTNFNTTSSSMGSEERQGAV